jgi:hypothetical protein
LRQGRSGAVVLLGEKTVIRNSALLFTVVTSNASLTMTGKARRSLAFGSGALKKCA